jgi:hypothetical protein
LAGNPLQTNTVIQNAIKVKTSLGNVDESEKKNNISDTNDLPKK